MAHISAVIPVYRNASSLEDLYNNLLFFLEEITKDFEVIFVEDAGGDNSWDIVSAIAAKDRRVKGLKLSRNFGQHYAITAGLDYSSGDWVVVMDADLQDKPQEIPRLYAKALEGYDVVLAIRKKRQDNIFKRASSRLFYGIFNYLTGLNYDGQVGNFRIISKKVVANYRLLKENLRFFGGLVDWLGFKTVSIEVEHGRRQGGKSGYTFRKLWRLAIDLIIAYSDRPLRIFVGFGLVMSALSFVYGCFLIVKTLLYGSSVMGWSSLIVSLYFIGGIIIANLGVLGMYLGKTLNEVKGRPLYIIDKKISL